MDTLPITLFKEIGYYLQPINRIYLYLTCKEAYITFFIPKKTFFKNHYLNTYKLCINCYKRCYMEDTVIILCKCLGNYSVKHYNCTSNNSFNFSLGISNCQFCTNKTMEFCKMYRRIA